MKALVGTFNQEKALVGAFIVIVKSPRAYLRTAFVSSSSQSSSVARQENMSECNNAGLLLAVVLHTSQTHIYTTNILIEN